VSPLSHFTSKISKRKKKKKKKKGEGGGKKGEKGRQRLSLTEFSFLEGGKNKRRSYGKCRPVMLRRGGKKKEKKKRGELM